MQRRLQTSLWSQTLRVVSDSCTAAGYRIIGTTDSADKTLYDIDIPLPVVLVMGSEQSGVRRNTREHCDQMIKIPMYGSVESLNLSVAAGIVFMRLRRRNAAGGEQHEKEQ